MSEKFTGYRSLEVTGDVIDSLYSSKVIEQWDRRLGLYPNLYLELKDVSAEKHTALARVLSDGRIKLLSTPAASGIKPKNREQVFALDALLDESITVVVLTGRAGTGKTLCSLAAGLEKVNSGRYEKMVLTKPMSEVGKYKLGALPGDVGEKFGPYLSNYTTNLEHFSGRNRVEDLMEQSNIDVMPIQLMRGASFGAAFVIADEMQVCNHMELLTVGTRIGEKSKLVLMGDLQQRDDSIAREKTGLHHLVNSEIARKSPLVAMIELVECERSPTARFFSDVFEGTVK